MKLKIKMILLLVVAVTATAVATGTAYVGGIGSCHTNGFCFRSVTTQPLSMCSSRSPEWCWN